MKKLLAVILICLAGPPHAPGETLYDQTLARLLESRFPDSGTSFLLVDARSGGVRAERWKDLAQPFAPGSLVKPFLALAYARTHEFKYPQGLCRGASGGCWYPMGHGQIGMVGALAYSCNSYFTSIARSLDPEEVSSLMAHLGAPGPEPGAGDETLIGLGRGWKMSPSSIAGAYRELIRRSGEPGMDEIIRGLALSARAGTGKGVSPATNATPSLVKTGTASCSHAVPAPGDGLAIVLYPASSPNTVLLVRVHGAPGMSAAGIAGKMLHLAVTGK